MQQRKLFKRRTKEVVTGLFKKKPTADDQYLKVLSFYIYLLFTKAFVLKEEKQDEKAEVCQITEKLG